MKESNFLCSFRSPMVLQNLGFGGCTLSVQAPIAANIKNVSELAGKRIVTSFPHLSKKFFENYESDDIKTSNAYFIQ